MAERIGLTEYCFYCHEDYKPNRTNHYCDDCVLVCDTCNTLKGLWCFEFNYETETYKEWKAKGAYGILPAPGHKTTCVSCIRERQDDPIQRLREAAKKLKPGQLELLLKSQIKEP